MIALACDHGGFELMKDVKAYLKSSGLEFKDFGTFSPESCDYPTVIAPAVKTIANGGCDIGIFICGTGIGVSIAANKVPGIRAALCTTVFMAEMARTHNDANVLALGGRVLESEAALEITDTFLNTEFSGVERHCHRVEMLNELDSLRG